MGISIPEGVERCKPCYSRGIWAPISENPVILGELENPYKTHTTTNKVIIGQSFPVLWRRVLSTAMIVVLSDAVRMMIV